MPYEHEMLETTADSLVEDLNEASQRGFDPAFTLRTYSTWWQREETVNYEIVLRKKVVASEGGSLLTVDQGLAQKELDQALHQNRLKDVSFDP